jgi:hypothetical protein
MRQLGVGVVALWLCGGCTRAPTNDDPVDAGAARDAAQPPAVVVPPDAAVRSSQCRDLGTWTGSGLKGSFDPDSGNNQSWAWVKIGTDAAPPMLEAGAWMVPTSKLGKWVSLSDPVQRQYASSTHGLLVWLDCGFPTGGPACAKGPYWQRSGMARFDQVPTASGQAFSGLFTDVELERITITNGQSTVVPGSDCLFVPSYTFAGTVLADSGPSETGSEDSLRLTAGTPQYSGCTGSNSECAAASPSCVTPTGLTGGICSLTCTSDAACGSAGTCIKYGTVGWCMATCGAGSSCATPGFTCHSYSKLAGGNGSVCAPPTWP